MSDKRVKRLHATLVSINKEFPYINSGGCGIFADFLCDIMLRKGYKCQVICLSSINDHSKAEHISNLRKIARMDTSSVFVYNHICLKIGNYYLDSYRLEKAATSYVFYQYYSKLGAISVDKLRYLISLDWKWNSNYDRADNKSLYLAMSALLSEF